MKTKFGIKTRVFLTFGFFIIITTNIFATFLYIFVEKSFIQNMQSNINMEYNNVIDIIDESKNKIIELTEQEEQNLADKGLFLVIGLDDKSIIDKYKIGGYVYKDNYVFRSDYEGYNILIGKNIRDLIGIKKYIIETTLLLNIFGLFISFFISYFVTNRVLKPLLKLSKYIRNYDLNEDKKFIINKYGSSEIGQITDSLNSFIAKVKENLQAQKNFIQDTSHELKTPLMQIETNIELIEDKIQDEKIKNKLENIKKSTRSIDKIVSNLGFILRGDEKIIKKQKIEIGKYLEDFVQNYYELAKSKNIKINIEKNNTLFIENNSYYLDRLFGNLITNSIYYNKGNNEINIIINSNSLQIIDSGIGINKDEVSKIFSRFYRNNNSNIYNEQGSGLGMTIVKKICDKFAWTIAIDSEPEKGTKIKITLK